MMEESDPGAPLTDLDIQRFRHHRDDCLAIDDEDCHPVGDQPHTEWVQGAEDLLDSFGIIDDNGRVAAPWCQIRTKAWELQRGSEDFEAYQEADSE